MTAMTSYYDRGNVVHLDGTRIFQTDEDRDNERDVASVIGARWNCKMRRFGALAPIDWYAERYGRLVGLAEMKARPHESGRYQTVFLNVRKWLALQLGSVGLGCPALFVVKFTDGIKWIKLVDVDGRRHAVAGCSRIVKSENDIEPIIYVDIASMRNL